MEMTLSLCVNCENAPGCTLRNGHPVMECEEHLVADKRLVKNGFDLNHTMSNVPVSFEHFKGLCGNCELKADCFWRNPEIITFHCEHYQ